MKHALITTTTTTNNNNHNNTIKINNTATITTTNKPTDTKQSETNTPQQTVINTAGIQVYRVLDLRMDMRKALLLRIDVISL